jgi:hypothetical protein
MSVGFRRVLHLHVHLTAHLCAYSFLLPDSDAASTWPLRRLRDLERVHRVLALHLVESALLWVHSLAVPALFRSLRQDFESRPGRSSIPNRTKSVFGMTMAVVRLVSRLIQFKPTRHDSTRIGWADQSVCCTLRNGRPSVKISVVRGMPSLLNFGLLL